MRSYLLAGYLAVGLAVASALALGVGGVLCALLP